MLPHRCFSALPSSSLTVLDWNMMLGSLWQLRCLSCTTFSGPWQDIKIAIFPDAKGLNLLRVQQHCSHPWSTCFRLWDAMEALLFVYWVSRLVAKASGGLYCATGSDIYHSSRLYKGEYNLVSISHSLAASTLILLHLQCPSKLVMMSLLTLPTPITFLSLHVCRLNIGSRTPVGLVSTIFHSMKTKLKRAYIDGCLDPSHFYIDQEEINVAWMAAGYGLLAPLLPPPAVVQPPQQGHLPAVPATTEVQAAPLPDPGKFLTPNAYVFSCLSMLVSSARACWSSRVDYYGFHWPRADLRCWSWSKTHHEEIKNCEIWSHHHGEYYPWHLHKEFPCCSWPLWPIQSWCSLWP